jgi:glycosyltransferase involved in cell wall biosynthesis
VSLWFKIPEYSCSPTYMRTSVIVASKDAAHSIRANLRALLDQIETGSDEILLVDASTVGIAEIARQEFPGVKLIQLPRTSLIPELWSAGLKEAKGEMVAVTTAHCVPDPSWLKAARVALENGYSGVGGAIKNSDSASIVSSAVYFCRYWRYMLPFDKHETSDLPGDNAAYKREDLFTFQSYFHEAFWEPFINARMRQKGMKLLMLPDMIVTHNRSFGIVSFILNRLSHGYHFGQDRSLQLPRIKRLLYFLGSPLIPIIYLKRIFDATGRKNLPRRELIRSLPLMALFLSAWALGEATAYLQLSTSQKSG